MEYKGYKISLNEKTGEFTLLVNGEDYFSNKDLLTVKAAADKLVKKVFERIPAYILGCVSYYYGEGRSAAYTEVEITSISPDGDIWIIDKNKNREKHGSYRESLYKRNAKNLIILKEIQKYGDETASIEKKVDALKKKLEPVKIKKGESDA